MAAATIGNFFSIPHSQLYAEPDRLAGGGYLSVRREEGGRRRKHYTLTARGRKALDEWLEAPTDEMYELRDPGLLKLAMGSDATGTGAGSATAARGTAEVLPGDPARAGGHRSAPAEQRLVVESGHRARAGVRQVLEAGGGELAGRTSRGAEERDNPKNRL